MLAEKMHPRTEALHPSALELDTLSTKEIVALLLLEEKRSLAAVEASMPDIARVADLVIENMYKGGRLIYVVAGTSGRLATLDAAECVPTFGIPKGKVLAIMAGGLSAFIHAVEGVEDDEHTARREMQDLILNTRDVVCGIAASGTTPFVIAALLEARQRDAHTVLITNGLVPEYCGRPVADMVVMLDTGPELIAGSTRLKAGTAQKMVLNALSTAVFVRLGKTYGGLMIDVQPTNGKLRKRASRIVKLLTGVSHERATELLRTAGWHVKKAIIMHHKQVAPVEAARILREHDDHLRDVI